MTNPTTSELIGRVAEQAGVEADVIESVATACGLYLVKACDDDEAAAIDLLREEPENAVGIALDDRIKKIRRMREWAHGRPEKIAQLVYDILTTEEAA